MGSAPESPVRVFTTCSATNSFRRIPGLSKPSSPGSPARSSGASENATASMPLPVSKTGTARRGSRRRSRAAARRSWCRHCRPCAATKRPPRQWRDSRTSCCLRWAQRPPTRKSFPRTICSGHSVAWGATIGVRTRNGAGWAWRITPSSVRSFASRRPATTTPPLAREISCGNLRPRWNRSHARSSRKSVSTRRCAISSSSASSWPGRTAATHSSSGSSIAS
mmetsp:Transcript_16904/g.35011  ORF Transcript_16904/g.35011 Transcript_16904/m.35011 type:complete len:222 (-) Transcript_16904:2969-3634(-)